MYVCVICVCECVPHIEREITITLCVSVCVCGYGYVCVASLYFQGAVLFFRPQTLFLSLSLFLSLFHSISLYIPLSHSFSLSGYTLNKQESCHCIVTHCVSIRTSVPACVRVCLSVCEFRKKIATHHKISTYLHYTCIQLKLGICTFYML